MSCAMHHHRVARPRGAGVEEPNIWLRQPGTRPSTPQPQLPLSIPAYPHWDTFPVWRAPGGEQCAPQSLDAGSPSRAFSACRS